MSKYNTSMNITRKIAISDSGSNCKQDYSYCIKEINNFIAKVIYYYKK